MMQTARESMKLCMGFLTDDMMNCRIMMKKWHCHVRFFISGISTSLMNENAGPGKASKRINLEDIRRLHERNSKP